MKHFSVYKTWIHLFKSAWTDKSTNNILLTLSGFVTLAVVMDAQWKVSNCCIGLEHFQLSAKKEIMVVMPRGML